MWINLFASTLHLVAPPAPEPDLFASLVAATERHDQKALLLLLSNYRLSTSRGTVGPDNYVKSGQIRYDVSATVLAGRLQGCFVKRWNHGPNAWLGPSVLWHCPAERVPENPCWFYTYRAQMFEPKDGPPSLLLAAMPDRDVAKCGAIVPPPPRWPGTAQ
jgi:hypothetical protein